MTDPVPSLESPDDQIRVLSLNCWGLKYVSKDRVQRIGAIASYLSTSAYDIVCLQELWVREDFELICTSTSNRLPFVKLFHSGAMGAGLAILSRFPIIAASMQPYSLNGAPLDFKGADWFAGKAAASVLITHPLLGYVQIFNTHFFSEGGDDGPEHNRAHRLVNSWEFAKLVQQSAEMGRYIIAAGDFNSAPSTLPMTVVCEHAGLSDAWDTSVRLSQDDTSQASQLDIPATHGHTYDSPLNSYASAGSSSQGKRLDFILYRNLGTSPSSVYHSLSAPPHMIPKDVHIVLTDLVPGHTFSYSDHFAVETTFEIRRSESKELLHNVWPSERTQTAVSTAAPTSTNTPHLSRKHTLMVIDALKIHLARSIMHARGEMRICIMCIIALAGILVGTGWNPRGFLTPVFVFVGSVITCLGTTMFYVGFLYRRWEANALRNAIEEMELHVHNLGSEPI